jgi:hypothetical protein
MYTKIIKLLQAHEFLGVSKKVDIAKGHKEAIHTFKEFKKQVKRSYHGRTNSI